MNLKKKVESKAAELTARTLTHVLRTEANSTACFKSGKMTVLMLYDSSCQKIFDSNLFIIKVIYFEGRYVL